MAELVRVKICGLVHREDALAADQAGSDYLGVVLSSGFARSVKPVLAQALVHGTRALKVALLVDESPEAAAVAAGALGADVLQLHGSEDPGVLEALRQRGEWALWKAVRARSLDDVERAVDRYAEVADAILVEGWQDGPPGRGGARVSLEPEQLRGAIPARLDFVLAGGLQAGTVADAVRRFRPDVVDVSSGVESALGVKDHALVRAFVDAARAPADASTRAAHGAPVGGRGP